MFVPPLLRGYRDRVFMCQVAKHIATHKCALSRPFFLGVFFFFSFSFCFFFFFFVFSFFYIFFYLFSLFFLVLCSPSLPLPYLSITVSSVCHYLARALGATGQLHSEKDSVKVTSSCDGYRIRTYQEFTFSQENIRDIRWQMVFEVITNHTLY